MFPQLPSSVGNRHEKWCTESGVSRKKNKTHTHIKKPQVWDDDTVISLHQGASGKKTFSLRSA